MAVDEHDFFRDEEHPCRCGSVIYILRILLGFHISLLRTFYANRHCRSHLRNGMLQSNAAVSVGFKVVGISSTAPAFGFGTTVSLNAFLPIPAVPIQEKNSLLG
jgi:hypothetical protein